MRAFRIGARACLALVLVTCTDRSLSGPRLPAQVGLDLRAFASSGGGQAPIPVDSVVVAFTQIGGGDVFDTAVGFSGLPVTSGSLSLSLDVPLSESPETFALVITVKGAGYTWYTATDTVTLTAGRNSPPPVTARFVGPGANGAFLVIGPQDTTVVPGLPVPLWWYVGDSSEGNVPGVPVGFHLQNPALGTITYATYLTPVLVPANPGTSVDTTWLIGETPNHLFDSTQIYISPRSGGGTPARIFLVSGDAQVDTPKAVLPNPLVALVTDTSGIPVAGARVAWQRTGLGTLVSGDTTAADSFGFARMTYQLPASLRTDTITASLVGAFAGPPPSVTFTATADTGLALTFDTAAYIIGKSQVTYFIEVQSKIPVSQDLTVQLTRSDSSAPAASQIFGIVGSSMVIPAGSQYGCCTEITGNNLGTATLVGRAAGYRAATATVFVTTPRLLVDSSFYTYNGTISEAVFVALADSTGAYHYTASDLVVHDSSADTTIVKPDSAAFTIAGGNFFALAYLGGVKPGSTTVTFRATNYPPAVTQVEVDTAFLYVYAGDGFGAGLGQTTTDNYVYLPEPPRVPLVVSFSSSDPSVFTVPATATLYPDSSGFVSFPITGTGLGSATLTVRAPGFPVSDSLNPVAVNTPQIQPVVSASVARGAKTFVYVYPEDTLGFRSGTVTAPLAVQLSTTDPNAVWDSTTITVPAGAFYDSVGVTFNSTGQFTVTATASGYTTGTTLTNAAAPPVGVAAVRALPVKVVPVYPDSLRRLKPARGRIRRTPPRR